MHYYRIIGSHRYYLHKGDIEPADLGFHPYTIRPKQAENGEDIVPAVVVASQISDIEGHLFHKVGDVVVHVEVLKRIAGVCTFEGMIQLVYLVPAVVVGKFVIHNEVDEDNILIGPDPVDITTCI